MAINLGGWSWVAGMAIDFGAPALATAFGIPGPVSAFAIKALKKALGFHVDAPEEEVKAAAEANPEVAKAAFQQAESEVTAKYAYLTRLAEMQADIAKANIGAVNETIRTEIAQGVSPWHWRHLIGYAFLAWSFVLVLPFILGSVALFRGVGVDLAAITGFVTAAVPILAIMAGILGYVAQDSTALKTAAITGQPVPGILSSVVAAVTPKKK